jgi:putative oxidoreductase
MRGRLDLGALVLRVGLGALFLTFGLDKFRRPDVILQQVGDAHMLPEVVVPVFARAIGVWEVGLGVLCVLGMLTRPAAVLSAAALASYTAYLGVVGQYPAFGLTQIGVVDRNVPLIAMALALALIGPGRVSLDALLARRRLQHVRSRLSVPEEPYGLPPETELV